MNTKLRARLITLVVRILAGLVLGLLAGLLIRNSGMTIVFLVALFGGAVLISWRLGPSRLLVVAAIWLGQYLVFYWRFVKPSPLTLDVATPVFITQGIFVFMPGMALVAGAYIGLIAEKMFRRQEKFSGADTIGPPVPHP
jgi:hypothetical protein